jgi:hypothetical protein
MFIFSSSTPESASKNVTDICARTGSQTPSSKTTTPSSTPHAPHGENSSPSPKPSHPSECATGLTSVSHHDTWYYCTGLLLPSERKSVEPIASIVPPGRVAAEHQSLLHFGGQSRWSDKAMLAKVRELTAPAFETQGGVEAWIVDDTGFQEEGFAFGRRGATILRAAGQDRQLSDCGDALDRQSSYGPARRLSPLSARRMGERPPASGSASTRNPTCQTPRQIAPWRSRAHSP